MRIFAERDTFSTPGIDVEDYIAVTVRYDNGAIGTFLTGSAVPDAAGASRAEIGSSAPTARSFSGTRSNCI